MRQDGEGDAVARSITRAVLGGLAATAFGLTGCAGTYDMITSERFQSRPFHTLFSSDDPMQVLVTVDVGDDRVKAMKRIKEPKDNGGSAEEQDKLIGILQASATADRRPLCRLAAVEALARFKDPRAGSILITAYNNAAYDGAQPAEKAELSPAAFGTIKVAVSQFAPDTVTMIQCRVLEGLGKHRSPEALQLLVQVAGTSTEKAKPATLEQAGAMSLEQASSLSEPDRFDVRLAAIRSLGNYDKDPTAIRTLVTILRTKPCAAGRTRPW
jgi:hypothetical protein